MPDRAQTRNKAALLGAAFLFAASGCGGGSVLRQSAAIQAKASGFTEFSPSAETLGLYALLRTRSNDNTLTIYIEGDGASWPSPHNPPRDPTPTEFIVLQMAIADPGSTTAYLGRPCQYLDASALRKCDAAYWSERRFAPEVIALYEQTIDALKQQTASAKLRLVGYSGGGVIATLLAAQRSDVDRLLTVAAPLDLERWVKVHGVSALTESLDPTAVVTKPLPYAVHWVGELDKVVPVAVVESFVARHGGTLRSVTNFDHVCCWAQKWTSLLEEDRR